MIKSFNIILIIKRHNLSLLIMFSENWRSKPLAVEALKGKAITKISAGTGFSIFARFLLLVYIQTLGKLLKHS